MFKDPFLLIPVFFAALLLIVNSLYIIETGHVGVTRTMGNVDMQEEDAGLHWKFPIITKAYEFSTKEISIDFNDLTPKARDNLQLQDLDVSIFYKVDPASVAEMMVKYAASYKQGKEALLPAYNVVFREARDVIYQQVTKIDSLDLHRNRDQLRVGISSGLQEKLDDKDTGVFSITRVAVRALNTDPTIEEAIQKAVQAQKTLEAKRIQVDIAEQDAEIEIAKAAGIAEANRIINSSLTPEYLQHELNEALKLFAENEGGVVVIPANMQGFNMILDRKSFNEK